MLSSACLYLQEALTIAPSETDAHFLLANAYDAQGKKLRADHHRKVVAKRAGK